jgi:2-phosphosulfolactate phosphatase
VAVVVDVLRASSVMVHALASGCEAVIPCLEIEDALRVASEYPKGQVVLGGERGGVAIEGFDLGNSPQTYSPEVCRGKIVVMTTTNGTRAILASLEAERIYVASFFNLSATLQRLRVESNERPIHLIGSGTEGHISLEDTLLVGAFAAKLAGMTEGMPLNPEPGTDPLPFANDEAHIAANQWLEVERNLPQTPLWHTLRLGRGGHNVRRLGLGPDIEDVARIDAIPLIAQLKRDPLRIEAIR